MQKDHEHMPPTIVYVHGISNQPPKDLLKLAWDDALLGHSAGSGSVMAYWADLRYPTPAGEPDAVGPDGLEGVPGAGDAEVVGDPFFAPEELVAETLAEVAAERAAAEPGIEGMGGAGATAGPELDDRLNSWLVEMAYAADAAERGDAEEAAGSGPAELGPGAGDLEALPLPRPARTAVFRALVKRAFADVYAYFFGGQGEAIKQRMRDALAAAGSGPLIVIGHSLGSVIAYDVLRESGPARDIPLFVTIGSPLAVTEIQDLVARPLLVPAGVRQWRNAADGRDLVALDKTIRPEFAPPDLTIDFLVDNTSTSHHGGIQYLESAPVKSAVAALLG
jgi:hypothetical protein